MALITLPYVFPTGTPLDIDNVNRDFHSTTDGASLYGELNGHLQDANFVSGFNIRPEHIRYGETARTREDHMVDTLDYYDDFTINDQEPRAAEYVPIAGCSTRVFLPYDTSVAVYSASIFYTVFRTRQRVDGSESDVRTGPDINIKMWIDGQALEYTTRQCPITYWPFNSDTAVARTLIPRENVLTQHYDINHLAINGGGDTARCLAGYHTISLRLYIPNNSGVETLTKPFKAATNNCKMNMAHRFRCGIRSARVVGLL